AHRARPADAARKPGAAAVDRRARDHRHGRQGAALRCAEEGHGDLHRCQLWAHLAGGHAEGPGGAGRRGEVLMATPAKVPRPAQRTAVSAAQSAGMVLGPHYRSYGLPWEIDPQEQQRLRRLLAWGLGAILLLGLGLPLVHLAPINQASTEVPDRLARLMVQQQVKPPPPIVQPKPKPKAETKPVPKPVTKPVETPK